MRTLPLPVLSILLDARYDPSGLTLTPVTVSLWPIRVYSTSPLRRSHTFKEEYGEQEVYSEQEMNSEQENKFS